MAPYPTTDSLFPDTSPLVAYLRSFPLVAPRFLHAIMADAMAPKPHAVILFLF